MLVFLTACIGGCERGANKPAQTDGPKSAADNTSARPSDTSARNPEINVVWLVIDAAAARYLGCYGNELDVTPKIDAFAKEATLFERAYSQAAWTLPSVASYMTGKYPPLHGLKESRVYLKWPLARVLRQAGYKTAAFSENPYVTRRFGLAIGFSHFIEYFPTRVVLERPRDFERTDSEQTADAVDAWLETAGSDPFFLYVHLLPPHAPYNPPSPFDTRFDNDYAGSVDGITETLLLIEEGKLQVDAADLEHLKRQYQENLAFADHQLGRILKSLKERNLLANSLVIITSDHGEAFLEHGHMQHNWTVYEEMIHVPLIIRFPSGQAQGLKRWEGVVQLVDLYPTIIETLDLKPPGEKLNGRSLLSSLQAGVSDNAAACAWTAMMPDIRATIVTQRYKLMMDLDGDNMELFDLKLDPGETRSVAASHEELAAELRALLQANEDPSIETEGLLLDEETLRRLRSLGYTD